jgi:peroxiredoxin
MSELQGLQSRIEDFRKAGAQIVAVSPDEVDQNRQVTEWLGLEFPVLSDRDLAATDAFGLRHAGASPDGKDLPRPATFILEGGAIRWRDLTESYRIRPRPDAVLEALRGLAPAP